MKLVERDAVLGRVCEKWRKQGLAVGLVPTMGALHAGHASLVRRAQKENDRVVVSIFVNPAQFGPGEDFDRYPRPFARDAVFCRKLGADILYHPNADEIYPRGFGTFVDVPGLSDKLCGLFRPGHFRGVATIVTKLLAAVRPRNAYFGEKDYQQLVIVRRLARDLDLGARIVPCPTIREEDGLAFSSRNLALPAAERKNANGIYQALKHGQAAASQGKTPGEIIRAVRKGMLEIPRISIDYIRLVDADTLDPAKALRGSLRLMTAVRLGKTRLIDNVPILA